MQLDVPPIDDKVAVEWIKRTLAVAPITCSQAMDAVRIEIWLNALPQRLRGATIKPAEFTD